VRFVLVCLFESTLEYHTPQNCMIIVIMSHQVFELTLFSACLVCAFAWIGNIFVGPVEADMVIGRRLIESAVYVMQIWKCCNNS